MKHYTSYICGGLGNQMFQYAAGRALSLQYSVPLYLDIHWFHQEHKTTAPRTFHLSIFKQLQSTVSHILDTPPSLYFRTLKKLGKIIPLSSIIQEPQFAYWHKFPLIKPSSTLIGYWQSEKYFINFQKEIRNDFIFPSFQNEQVQTIARQIKCTQNTISLHIRRGDYINNQEVKSIFGNLQNSYYTNALNYINSRIGEINIFVFSDDPLWAAHFFNNYGHKYTIIDLKYPDKPYYDMYLMSLCQHHIIANSSFSWWGAWLGEKPGITIAPQKWFAKKSFDEYKVIYCNSWIIL